MLNLFTRYGAGVTTAPNTDYPAGGSFKNESNPGVSRDGTPYERDWVNDVRGFFEAVIKRAGVAISGAVETANTSQVLDGLTSIIRPRLFGWLASDAVETEDRFDFAAQATGAVRVQWDLEGATAYVLDTGSKRVYQYTASTPYELRSLTYDGLSLDVSALGAPNAVTINHAGTRLYVAAGTTAVVLTQYDLVTPGDVSSGVYAGEYAVTGDHRSTASLSLSANGFHLLLTGQEFIGTIVGGTRHLVLGTAGDVTTASDPADKATVGPTSAYASAFNADGSTYTSFSAYYDAPNYYPSFTTAYLPTSYTLAARETLHSKTYNHAREADAATFALDGSRVVSNDDADTTIAITHLISRRA